MKFLLTNTHLSKEKTFKKISVKIQFNKGLYYLISEGNKPMDIPRYSAFINGYLRNFDENLEDYEAQNRSTISELTLNWPPVNNITGSFSAVIIDHQENKITVCTDQIGLYPLYYLIEGDNWYVSNSIIWLGAISQASFDPAGIVQRSMGPELATLGSRTILNNCKRLLPGECIRWNKDGKFLNREYDNRLYQNLSKPVVDTATVQDYWEAYKKEVNYCVNYSHHVNVALSGGIDSRAVLGAIPNKKKIACYTYGAPDNYETLIAKKLTKKRKADFYVCHQPHLYFPSVDLLKNYTLRTEGVELCSWLEITETVSEKKNEPLLLGELCEALPARNIKRFSSKSFKKENFLKYYVFQKKYPFTRANKENFDQWKERKINGFLIYYQDRKLNLYDINISKQELVDALMENLSEIFSRIEAHNLPFAELYDELFSWYTYTRMHLSKHLLVADSKFNAYSPAMSMHMLTKTSQLHPNIRLNYRFAEKMFKVNKDLKKLSKIPTAQVPVIPQYFPDILKFLVWGMRSGVDQFLIKRMMKNKEPGKKYRLLKSINWAQVYQDPDMEKKLRGYFEPNLIGRGFFEDLYIQSIARKNLERWPFANMDIINAASLNTELNLIKEKRI